MFMQGSLEADVRFWLPFMSRGSWDRCSTLGCGGSGKWLVRRADVRGQVGHAGLKCRPRVPSRARRLGPVLVLEHLPVDDIGQASLELSWSSRCGEKLFAVVS
jgi:hypothetical protein